MTDGSEQGRLDDLMQHQQGEPSGIEAALSRLEEIARTLEEGKLDLQTSLNLYREAKGLHGWCVERLAAAEAEMQVLLADGRLAPEKWTAENGGE